MGSYNIQSLLRCICKDGTSIMYELTDGTPYIAPREVRADGVRHQAITRTILTQFYIAI